MSKSNSREKSKENEEKKNTKLFIGNLSKEVKIINKKLILQPK